MSLSPSSRRRKSRVAAKCASAMVVFGSSMRVVSMHVSTWRTGGGGGVCLVGVWKAGDVERERGRHSGSEQASCGLDAAAAVSNSPAHPSTGPA
eukprot:5584943-Prymnesium_polylepis.1